MRTRSRRAGHWSAIVAGRTAEQEHLESKDESEEPRARLQEAIAELPTHLRNVIVLRDLSAMSYNEVGRTLGIEPATARVYRRHAVVKLAELLGQGSGS